MRLHVTMSGEEGLFPVPFDCNFALQAAIYALMDADTASFLHDRGYEREKRTFKPFVFSGLMGQRHADPKTASVIYRGRVRLVISSPLEEVCTSILNGLLRQGELRVGPSVLRVESVISESPRVNGNSAAFVTLSPVVAYSTLERDDGRKYTQYYSPSDEEFTRIVHQNLRKKWEAFFSNPAPTGDFSLAAVGVPRPITRRFKGNIVRGYSFSMKVSGPQPILQLALDAGLGSKNAQGWGCLAPISDDPSCRAVTDSGTT